MLNTEGYNWTSCGRTDAGKVRTVNEDSILDLCAEGLWMVADGMGGHAAGDVASRTIIEKFAHMKASADANELICAIEDGLLDVHEDLVRQAANRTDLRTMGSTVAALIAFHKKCFTMWAGDSRIYRVRNGQLKRITNDHSRVQDMVDSGLLTEEEAEKHPQAHIITRAVGAHRDLYVDLDVFDVEAGDRYMICSDGLYKEVMDDEMADLINLGTVGDACNALVDLTLERGSRDNVSVIVVQTGET